MRKQVMVRAWEIAKEAVRNFGGKVSEFFRSALTIAWSEAKEVNVVCRREELKDVTADFVAAVNERVEILRSKGKNELASAYVRMINVALAKAPATDNLFAMMVSIKAGNTGLSFSSIVNDIKVRYGYVVR